MPGRRPWRCRVLRPAGREQHRGIEHLHIDVVVRRGGGDLSLGRTTAFGELPLGPAASDDQPGALRRVLPAARMRSTASASVRAPIQCTSVVKLSPARMAWMWESISPGMTVRPARSTTRVAGARERADVRRAADARDPAVAHRQGFGRRGTVLTILPSRRMVSAGCASAVRRIIATSRPTQTCRRRARMTGDIYSRCSVQLVSMFMSLSCPADVRTRDLLPVAGLVARHLNVVRAGLPC